MLWVPSRWQIADAFTKPGMEEGLREILIRNKVKLHEESEQAIRRKRKAMNGSKTKQRLMLQSDKGIQFKSRGKKSIPKVNLSSQRNVDECHLSLRPSKSKKNT